MARFDRSSAAGVAYGSAAPAIEVRGLSFAIPGPRHRCSRDLIGVFPKVRLHCWWWYWVGQIDATLAAQARDRSGGRAHW